MIHRISSWQKKHDAIREIESVRLVRSEEEERKNEREREREERKGEKRREGKRDECVYPRHISIRKIG